MFIFFHPEKSFSTAGNATDLRYDLTYFLVSLSCVEEKYLSGSFTLWFFLLQYKEPPDLTSAPRQSQAPTEEKKEKEKKKERASISRDSFLSFLFFVEEENNNNRTNEDCPYCPGWKFF